MKEENIDVATGIITIKHNKVPDKFVKIYLIPEDVELIKSFPKALPHLYFFRHKKRKGVHKNKRHRFGKDYWYTWWKRACKNLGVEGIDLYGGTRHSTVIELGEYLTPEEIMGEGTEHTTNKAFKRYFQLKAEKKRKVSARARGKADVIELKMTKN